MRLSLRKPVPPRAERYQCLLVLLEEGITEQMIRDAIAAIPDMITRERHRLRFEMPFWLRDSEFISWGMVTFNLTEERVDDLFRRAVLQ